jgi:hypothetical protein
MVSMHPDWGSIGNSPVPEVAASAAKYRQGRQQAFPEQDYSSSAIAPSRSAEISRAYEALPSYDPSAVGAYKQMAEETGRQFDHMTKPWSKGGLGLDVSVHSDDPYGMHGGQFQYEKVMPEMRADVQNNNHIGVLSTKSTGGHPVFTNDQNDMFRAVHDVYGHLGSGRGIDHNGEEAAFQKHAAMFSPLARQAMATETRGQNSYLRQHGDFPEQKVATMPAQFQAPRNLSGVQFSDVQLGRQKNMEQGL